MAYEVYERTAVRVGEPVLSLVPDGRMALNAAACRVLKDAGVKTVVLLWDKETKKIALKAVPKTNKNAYAVSFTENHSGGLRATKFLTYIGWRATSRVALPATWSEKDKMLEATLPQKHLMQDGETARKLKPIRADQLCRPTGE